MSNVWRRLFSLIIKAAVSFSGVFCTITVYTEHGEDTDNWQKLRDTGKDYKWIEWTSHHTIITKPEKKRQTSARFIKFMRIIIWLQPYSPHMISEQQIDYPCSWFRLLQLWPRPTEHQYFAKDKHEIQHSTEQRWNMVVPYCLIINYALWH